MTFGRFLFFVALFVVLLAVAGAVVFAFVAWPEHFAFGCFLVALGALLRPCIAVVRRYVSSR